MRALRLLPRLVRDRLPATGIAAAIILVLLLPALAANRSMFAEGLMAGQEPGPAALAPFIALVMLLMIPWLAEGLASAGRADGGEAFTASRPGPRIAVPMARWLAGLACSAGLAVLVATVADAVWILGLPDPATDLRPGSLLHLPGAAAGGVVLWAWAGSVMLPLSASLRRAEAPLGMVLLVLPLAVGGMVAGTDHPLGILARLPSARTIGAARIAMLGGWPEPSALLAVGAGGAVALAVGLLLVTRREVGA
ncbi:MAG: hypothetical protein RRA92_02685 [Gemmatimonadota bacterium]|nr:hypothetical protein [Gemmatimonadota bacterium]